MKLSHALSRAFVCAVALSVLSAAYAVAHHDDGSVTWVRDNNTQEYDYNDLTPGGKLACDHGAAQLARSEITVKKGSNDIHCHDGYEWRGAAGTTSCTSTVWWNGRCGHFRVWFNTAGEANARPETGLEKNYWKALGCHEFGHTGSIGHVSSSTTCMKSGLWTSWFNPITLTQADLAHINAAL